MSEHETYAEVVKFARRELEGHERISCWFWPEFVRELIDRLEAAHKQAIEKCKTALAAPARNCEVGTVEEQSKRFMRYCQKNRAGICNSSCPLFTQRASGALCSLSWAQLPYESEVPKCRE